MQQHQDVVHKLHQLWTSRTVDNTYLLMIPSRKLHLQECLGRRYVTYVSSQEGTCKIQLKYSFRPTKDMGRSTVLYELRWVPSPGPTGGPEVMVWLQHGLLPVLWNQVQIRHIGVHIGHTGCRIPPYAFRAIKFYRCLHIHSVKRYLALNVGCLHLQS